MKAPVLKFTYLTVMDKKIQKRLFFVEDDLPFGGVLKTFLELHDYQVDWFNDGKEAIKGFESEKYDIAILDVMLPNADGFEIASHIRSKESKLPFVFMTAKTLKEDVLKGYKTGADDYIAKPFDTEVLLYKLEAILKRNQGLSDKQETTFQIGKYQYNAELRELSSATMIKRLSPREGELLKLLIQHKNTLLPRSLALEKLWGENDYFNGRSMDVYITKLRKYISDDPGLSINSIPRSGFIFSAEENL